jgi:hypothetical protein
VDGADETVEADPDAVELEPDEPHAVITVAASPVSAVISASRHL